MTSYSINSGARASAAASLVNDMKRLVIGLPIKQRANYFLKTENSPFIAGLRGMSRPAALLAWIVATMGLKNTLNGSSICPGSASCWEIRLTSSGQSKNNETNSNPIKSNLFHYSACAGPALFPAERSQADLLPLALCFRLFDFTYA